VRQCARFETPHLCSGYAPHQTRRLIAERLLATTSPKYLLPVHQLQGVMADFAGSSQVSSWLFTAPALGKYLEMPAPCHMQRILNDAEEHRVAANSGNTDEVRPHEAPPYMIVMSQAALLQALALSASQRAMLLRHFEQSLLRCTAALRFDETLQASAVTLFKRFYVHNAFVKGAPFQIACVAFHLLCRLACP